MTTKEWLSRGRELNREIDALLEARDNAFRFACRADGPAAGEKVQQSRENTREKIYVSYIAYTQEIDAQIDKLCDILREIEQTVNNVQDSTLRTLLTERYINFKTWEKIAESMNYADRWVRGGLHSRALNAITEFIEKNSGR